MSQQPTTNEAGGIRAIDTALRRIARRARAALLGQRALTMLAAVIGAAIALGVLDYFMRFPAWLRTGHLALGALTVAIIAWRWLLPAWRFRPGVTAIALRLERNHPRLRGLLASGVEFADDRDANSDTGVSRALAAHVVREASTVWRADNASRALRLGGLTTAAAWFAVAAIVAIGVTAAAPSLSSIGATRAFAPWAGAEWPKRTAVADATGVDVHPLGAALPLRALVTRSPWPMDRTDVTARYRPVRDGVPGPAQRALLTWQERSSAEHGDAGGAIFERLVEVDAEAVEYRFETEDDVTEWRRVRLVEPPSVVSAAAVITPPEYAAGLTNTGEENAADAPLATEASIDMGAGLDERAIAPLSLAGSRVSLSLRLNKPVPASPLNPRWVAETLGADAAAAEFEVSDDRLTWRLSWTLVESARIGVNLVDEHGIASVDEAVFRFEGVADREPTATVTTPASDTTVLATALVDVVGEGRDDVGLDWVLLERQRARPAGAEGGEPSGPGGAVEPVGESEVAVRIEAAGKRTAEARATIDLSTLGLRPGDELWLTAVAADILAAGEPARSRVRRLFVITEREFVEEVLQDLSSIRRSAIRVEDQQAALRGDVAQGRADEETRRGQSQVSERIARDLETVDRLDERVRENGLNEQGLADMLAEAARSLQRAGQASAQASGALDEAAAPQQAEQPEDEPELTDDQRERIGEAQEQVREELAELIEMLDRGEDAWVMRNALQELLREQQALREATGEAANQTAGRSADELTPQERSELQRIVEKQRELAERVERTEEELQQRAREMREQDPSTAAGMQQAAQRARESGVQAQMEQAAEQAAQNQMSSAGQSQEQAIEDLEEMLEDLDRAERAREEELSRVLQSLIESLTALITRQEGELQALAAAEDAGNLADAGLDAGMIRLNQNTLGVLEMADSGGTELSMVATLVGQAGEAQTRAVLALRAEAIDGADARTHEEASLDFLKRAKAEAERVQQQLQQQMEQRKREELRRAYRAALETQIALREDAAGYAARNELTRRDRVMIRGVGERQRELSDTLESLLTETAELQDARIFEFAHRRLDALTGGAADALLDARPGDALSPQGSAITVLQGIVESLKEGAPGEGDDGFSQGGGSGSGGQPQTAGVIPPLAELKLLRSLQIDLAVRTRNSDEGAEPPTKGDLESLGGEQRELSKLAEDLAERAKQQSQPAPAPVGPGPNPDADPPPADPADVGATNSQ